VRQEFADPRDDLGSVQLDIGHQCLARELGHAVLQVEAGCAPSGEIGGDLLGDGLRRPDVERTPRPGLMAKDSLVGAAGPGQPARLLDDGRPNASWP
jgi:hypothetical protein